MSERLTDEQVQRLGEYDGRPLIAGMAQELLALRALIPEVIEQLEMAVTMRSPLIYEALDKIIVKLREASQ